MLVLFCLYDAHTFAALAGHVLKSWKRSLIFYLLSIIYSFFYSSFLRGKEGSQKIKSACKFQLSSKLSPLRNIYLQWSCSLYQELKGYEQTHGKGHRGCLPHCTFKLAHTLESPAGIGKAACWGNLNICISYNSQIVMLSLVWGPHLEDQCLLWGGVGTPGLWLIVFKELYD